MSNCINNLLRPVFGIVLATDLVLLKMEELMLWLQSVIMKLAFPSGGSYYICKVTQEIASDTEPDSIVLIINCCNLFFCDSGRPRRFQPFYKQEAGDVQGPLYLRQGYGAGFCSVSRGEKLETVNRLSFWELLL